MDIRFQCLGPDQWKAEILIVPVCQGENMLEACPALDNLAPWLAIAPAMRDFQGKKGQQALLHGHPELRVPRVLAIGLGAREDLTTDDIRTAVATGVQRAHELGLESILLLEPQLATLPGGRERLVEESVYAACLALYKYDLKKPAKDAPAAPQWLAVAFEGDFVPDGGQQAARRGEQEHARAKACKGPLGEQYGGGGKQDQPGRADEGSGHGKRAEAVFFHRL